MADEAVTNEETNQEETPAQEEPSTEAYWFLFRFLCGGHFVDRGLIIGCDDLLGGGVAQGIMEAFMVRPVDLDQCRPFDLCA